MTDIETLQKFIDESKDGGVVFFGGAGVSTESGIPDFRSVDGLYNQNYKYPPEQIISHSFFVQNPAEFYRFYFDRMIFDDARPNDAHIKLAELEDSGKLGTIVTQNIDGLHEFAGSKNVLDIHGTVLDNHCTKCGKYFSLEDITSAYRSSVDGIPRCVCGGIIKPDVVLYEEPLDSDKMERAINCIASAETLIIAGTSLVVQPAASFVNYFTGRHLVIINLSPTSLDQRADLCIAKPVGEVFRQIKVNW